MIVVECYADTAVALSLTNLPRKNLHHSRGRAAVCDQLSHLTNSKGLIDEDPASPRHPYERAGKVRDDYVDSDIRLVQYPAQGNSLIIVRPRLEEWVLKTAEIAHIDVSKHGIPDDSTILHRDIDKLLDKVRILLDMLKRQRSPRILALTDLLKLEA